MLIILVSLSVIIYYDTDVLICWYNYWYIFIIIIIIIIIIN